MRGGGHHAFPFTCGENIACFPSLHNHTAPFLQIKKETVGGVPQCYLMTKNMPKGQSVSLNSQLNLKYNVILFKYIIHC